MDDPLMNAAATRAELGNVSAMFLHRRLHDDPSFPRPIVFRPRGPRYWRRSEIVGWIERHRRVTQVVTHPGGGT